MVYGIFNRGKIRLMYSIATLLAYIIDIGNGGTVMKVTFMIIKLISCFN